MAFALLKTAGQNKKFLIYKKIKKWYNIYNKRTREKEISKNAQQFVDFYWRRLFWFPGSSTHGCGKGGGLIRMKSYQYYCMLSVKKRYQTRAISKKMHCVSYISNCILSDRKKGE